MVAQKFPVKQSAFSQPIHFQVLHNKFKPRSQTILLQAPVAVHKRGTG